jgi:hypothetical protein
MLPCSLSGGPSSSLNHKDFGVQKKQQLKFSFTLPALTRFSQCGCSVPMISRVFMNKKYP